MMRVAPAAFFLFADDAEIFICGAKWIFNVMNGCLMMFMGKWRFMN
jgi:hypothetical protein